ncbi:MAG: AAA family ATPase [Acidimicrobiia bacterium]|nr:AAA family ATPase [Acidimicrobiia bacterium]
MGDNGTEDDVDPAAGGARRAPRRADHGVEPPFPEVGPTWLVVVTGWTGAGKSTIADLIAQELHAAVGSFDWLMSGLRAVPEVWAAIELPIDRQRRVGWNLLGRVAEQQLRRGTSCVLDLVAREEPRVEWEELAERYGAAFGVVECVCPDVGLHRSRVEGRRRDIPGWYELEWANVARGRELYRPLAEPKLVLDAADSIDDNLDKVKRMLFGST